MRGATSQSRIDRNLREKHRRLHFKDLIARLASLLPAQTSRASALDSLDQAISYIRQSQERIMMLSKRLEQLSSNADNNLREISVTGHDNELEVNFRVNKGSRRINLQEMMNTIEEEGAEIISLTYSNLGGQLLGTIHSKAIYARIGIEISNVKERLRQLSFRHD